MGTILSSRYELISNMKYLNTPYDINESSRSIPPNTLQYQSIAVIDYMNILYDIN